MTIEKIPSKHFLISIFLRTDIRYAGKERTA